MLHAEIYLSTAVKGWLRERAPALRFVRRTGLLTILFFAIGTLAYGESNTIDFENWDIGTTYGEEEINVDFPGGVRTTHSKTGASFRKPKGNFTVVAEGKNGKCLKHVYPGKRDYTSRWGAKIEPHKAYTAQWWVKYSSDMDFNRTGKMMGFAEHRVHHREATGDGGYSCRVAWWNRNRDNSNGTMNTYAYHMDHPSNIKHQGQGWHRPQHYLGGFQTFERDTWYQIRLYVERNNGSAADGIMRVWVNDVLKFEKTDFRWCTDESNWDTFDFTWHQGGGDESVIGKGTVYIDEIRYWHGVADPDTGFSVPAHKETPR